MATSAQLSSAGEAMFLPDRQQSTVSVDISTIFSAGILTRYDHRDSWVDQLTPVEKAQIGDVCEKRYAEFAAGRSQARQLIAALTGVAETLPVGEYRQPLWPQSVIGSISHSDDYCAVAVSRRSVVTGLGVDVEPYEDLDADVADIVLTDSELATTRTRDAMASTMGNTLVDEALIDKTLVGGKAHKLIFSIKEAIYKCCYPQVRAFIDFKQCEVTLDPQTRSYKGVIDCCNADDQPVHLEVTGKWMIEAGHIFASAEFRR